MGVFLVIFALIRGGIPGLIFISMISSGVDITILTPGEKTGQNYVRRASHTLWGDLMKAGSVSPCHNSGIHVF